MLGRDQPSTPLRLRARSTPRQLRKKAPIDSDVGVMRKGLSSTRTAGQKRRQVMDYVFAPPLPYKRARTERAPVPQPSGLQAELQVSVMSGQDEGEYAQRRRRTTGVQRRSTPGGSPSRNRTRPRQPEATGPKSPSLENVLNEAWAYNERAGTILVGNPGRMMELRREQKLREKAGELAAPTSSASSAHLVSAASADFLPLASAPQHRAILSQPTATPAGVLSALEYHDDGGGSSANSNVLESYVSGVKPTSPMPTPQTKPHIPLSAASSQWSQGAAVDLHGHRRYELHASPAKGPKSQDNCNCENSARTPAPNALCSIHPPATISEVAATPGVAPVPALDLGNAHGAKTLNADLNLTGLREDSETGAVRIALTELEIAKAISYAFGALGMSTVMAIPSPLLSHPASGHVSHTLPRGTSPRENPSDRRSSPPSAIPLQPLLSHPASSTTTGRVSHAVPGTSPRQNPSGCHTPSAMPLQTVFLHPASSTAGCVAMSSQPLFSHPASSPALPLGAPPWQNPFNRYNVPPSPPSTSLDSPSMPHAHTPSYDDFFASIRKPVYNYWGAGPARST
ncbi:hypothetical protein B0H11DRAFT_2274819 [Mycena galericulata]|nr:hypothetical protein B0H11DRAFT_2274819 [Mycena galericulata]